MSTPTTRILSAIDYPREILQGVKLLEEGRLIVLPTETVYGAAALLTRPDAVTRLKSIRGGNQHKPLTVHIAQSEDAAQYLGDISELESRAMRKLWPGPVGIMFQVDARRQREVAERLKIAHGDLYDDSSITLRCPDHAVFRDIAAQVSGPVALAAVGSSSFKIDDSLLHALDGKVDLIFDAGPTRFARPSTLVKISSQGWEVSRVGVYDARIIERLLRTTILFICSGNTCRSPMAEGLAHTLLSRKLDMPEEGLEKKGFTVVSAGASAMAGIRAAAPAVDAARALGADISRHRSRTLSVELLHQADLVYVMSKAHGQAAQSLAPAAAGKIFRLDPDADIEDPIGGDAELYAKVATRINDLIAKRLIADLKLEKVELAKGNR